MTAQTGFVERSQVGSPVAARILEDGDGRSRMANGAVLPQRATGGGFGVMLRKGTHVQFGLIAGAWRRRHGCVPSELRICAVSARGYVQGSLLSSSFAASILAAETTFSPSPICINRTPPAVRD